MTCSTRVLSGRTGVGPGPRVSGGCHTVLRLRDNRQDHSGRSLLKTFGVGGLKRMLFPLIALCLVLLLRKVLLALQWDHLSLLYLAAPLLIFVGTGQCWFMCCAAFFPHGGFLTSFERLITFVIWGGLVLHITDFADPLIEMLEQVSFTVGKQKFDLWLLMHGTVTVLGTVLLAAVDRQPDRKPIDGCRGTGWQCA